MGLFSALFSGVNGINSNGNVISVIGDNIANVNTIGYKSSRAAFEDILAGSDSNVGLGSRVASITAQFGQGGFESSSSVTDLAIDGKGFFMVKDPGDNSKFYSRAGQFVVDRDGYLANNKGLRLQGFSVDTSNNLTANVSDISISTTPVSPNDTGEIALVMNLNSNSTTPAAFSTATPTTTSNFSTGVTVFDSLGNSHLVTIYFRKSASNSWSWYGLINGSEVTGPSSGVNVQAATGTLTFNSAGALTSAATTTSDFDFLGATQSQAITFDFGSIVSTGNGLDGATQFGSDSAVSNITQDGYASGSLKSIEISPDGTITGNYTNGTNQTIAQVVLATFSDETSLRRVGGNNYQETLGSGQPTVNGAGVAGKGNVVSSTLEQSNVDLANELIKMVIIQRGFQANTRTISTVNDLLAQLVTLGQ